jgi:hypothetical protein
LKSIQGKPGHNTASHNSSIITNPQAMQQTVQQALQPTQQNIQIINHPLKIQPNYIQPINSQSSQNNSGSIIPQNQTNNQNKVTINQPLQQIQIQQPSINSNQQNQQFQKQQTSDHQIITEKSNQVATVPTQAPPRTNFLQQISMSIETCNLTNPIHKNNIRYLIQNIQEAINGGSSFK